jgi:hypothetical protein
MAALFFVGGGVYSELEVTNREATVDHLFLEPQARHLLVSLVDNTKKPVDFVYVHCSQKKGRSLPRLKGLSVSCVGWNKSAISQAGMREVVIGTKPGVIYELEVQEKEKRERVFKQLYEVGDSGETLEALQLEVLSGPGHSTNSTNQYFLMAVTTTRCFVYSATGSLEALFYVQGMQGPLVDLPGQPRASELHFRTSGQHKHGTTNFAWLAGPGVYNGLLHLGASSLEAGDTETSAKQVCERSCPHHSPVSNPSSPKSTPTSPESNPSSPESTLSSPETTPFGVQMVREHTIMPFPASLPLGSPISMAVTEYHYLLLYEDSLQAVNRLSGTVASRCPAPRGCAPLRGLATDSVARIIYLFSDEALFEVTTKDEGRDMWRLHLERKEFASALEHCKTPQQRDQVFAVQAEEAFVSADYMRAAAFYARTPSAAPFEEVALKLIEANQPEALRTFLLHKLDNLGGRERSQQTMLATWLTELYLDQINKAAEAELSAARTTIAGGEGSGGEAKNGPAALATCVQV